MNAQLGKTTATNSRLLSAESWQPFEGIKSWRENETQRINVVYHMWLISSANW
jgi:hypothetical protein